VKGALYEAVLLCTFAPLLTRPPKPYTLNLQPYTLKGGAAEASALLWISRNFFGSRGVSLTVLDPDGCTAAPS